MDSLGEDNDDEKMKSILKYLGKENRCLHGVVHETPFYVRQKYKSKNDIKEKVNQHFIKTRRNLFLKKDKVRLKVECRGIIPEVMQVVEVIK